MNPPPSPDVHNSSVRPRAPDRDVRASVLTLALVASSHSTSTTTPPLAAGCDVLSAEVWCALMGTRARLFRPLGCVLNDTVPGHLSRVMRAATHLQHDSYASSYEPVSLNRGGACRLQVQNCFSFNTNEYRGIKTCSSWVRSLFTRASTGNLRTDYGSTSSSRTETESVRAPRAPTVKSLQQMIAGRGGDNMQI